MLPIIYNLRSLRGRLATSLAAAGGLALVVFVFASIMMLSSGIQRALHRSAHDDIAVVLRKGATSELGSTVDESSVAIVGSASGAARRADGTPAAIGELVGLLRLQKTKSHAKVNVQIRGVPDLAMEYRPTMQIVAGRRPTPGTEEVMIGAALRGGFEGLDLDQSFSLRKNRLARVVGVFSDGGSAYESEIWADLHVMASAFGRQAQISSIRVKLMSAASLATFQAAVEQDPRLGLSVQSEPVFYEQQSEGTGAFMEVLGALIALLMSICAMIGALVTMNAAIADRQREIGTLRALGFSRRAVLTSLLLEALMLGLAGGLVGVAASLGMCMVKISTLNFATQTEMVFSFSTSPEILLISLVLAASLGLLGGFLPAVRAALIRPIEALRG